MGGYMIAPNIVNNFRHDTDKKQIILATHDNSRFVVNYQALIKLDLKETGTVFIYDWFDMKTGSSNCPDIIRGDNNHPQKLVFYDSKRPKVKNGLKDFVAISKIPETKIGSWDYSELAIQYASLQIFKKHGIKGAACGYDRKGKQRYSRIKIEHGWREIKSELNCLHTLEELCKTKQKGSHLTNLTTSLFSTSKTSTSQE
jgi:hypothetical protein